MTRRLDLADIQGNILSAYGHLGFPRARYLFLHVAEKKAGRDFITALLPRITTALRWKSAKDHSGEDIPKKPQVAYNLAFNYRGLQALGLPTETLRAMPTEFIDGMAARAHILGDQPEILKEERQPPVPAHWDAIWRDSKGDRQVHILLSLNAGRDAPDDALDVAFDWVADFCARSDGGIAVLPGHGPDGLPYQDACVLLRPSPHGKVKPSRQEHFGFADGFGDPVFDGQYPPETEAQAAIGGGKLLPDQTWAPLATGEFLLGYPDEAQEVPGETYPFEFIRNGTFMAYRKLHENVASFRNYIADAAKAYAQVMGLPGDQAGLEEARQTIMAKMAGRWQNGVPLMVAPTYADSRAFEARRNAAHINDDAAAISKFEQSYVDFTYRSDPLGAKCPMTSHIRRVNPRDGLDPTGDSPKSEKWNGSVLNNRRRILRRGLPYGVSDPANPDDRGEHGIIFLAVCASLFRQFEFVQQQWIQYGLDAKAGNDTCPLLGNHDADAKFVIPVDRADKPPFVCAKLPQLVEVRGGDYFFIPSMTGLRMLGMGIVDPT
ncbi:MAG TPA: hypothetical protein VI298_10865 [Geobacteraceae bacterium]